MKTTALLALFLSLPLAIVAVPGGDAVLIKAETIRIESGQNTIATGAVSVISGDFRITADELTADLVAGVVTVSGNVTLHSGRGVLKTRELTLELQGRRIFLLSKGQIIPGGERWEQVADSKERMFHFATPFPRTETSLKR